MSFYGKTFVFDGKASDIYGLFCAKRDASGVDASPLGSETEVIEDYVNRRDAPYFYGVLYNTKLTFPISFFSESPIPRERVSEISRWLFGLPTYRKLKIIQDDMGDIYYNCMLTQNNLVCIGNEVYGFESTVVCDSPWAYGKDFTFSKANVTGNIKVNNTSDNNRYTKPMITLNFSSGQSNVSVQNTSDIGSSKMTFSTVTSGEIITINCDQRIISSNRELIQDRFNGKYIYLVPGINLITLTGTMSITIKYTPAKKVGS